MQFKYSRKCNNNGPISASQEYYQKFNKNRPTLLQFNLNPYPKYKIIVPFFMTAIYTTGAIRKLLKTLGGGEGVSNE